MIIIDDKIFTEYKYDANNNFISIDLPIFSNIDIEKRITGTNQCS
jgi:hypothetical protein